MAEPQKDPYAFLDTIDESRKPYAEEVIAKALTALQGRR